MIIHKPKITIVGNKVRISCYLEMELHPHLSNELWFEFDKKYKKYISGSCNPFVSATTLFAMCLQEDIKAKGVLSPKLVYGLKQLQGYFNFWQPKDFDFWRPKKFHTVNISGTGYKVDSNNARSVGSSFTGGVDSFYTLYHHTVKKDLNPDYRITHCLIIDNGARPLYEISEDSYDLLKNKYTKFLKNLDIELITVQTNVEEVFGGVISGNETHATTILSSALILDKLFSRFYIPSSYNYADQVPWGSNPVTDPLLSTETLEIKHHGCEKTRVDKTIEVAKWKASYDNLRVCWVTKGTKNCGQCSKCIRTMLALEMDGSLFSYTVFATPLTRKKVRNWVIEGTDKTVFTRGVLNHAKKIGRKDIIFDINYAMRRTQIKNGLFKFKSAVTDIAKHTGSKAWALIWAPSAQLKKRSKTYENFVNIIKNDNSRT